MGCIQSVDWTSGLIDFHLKTQRCSIMLPKVPLWAISMLGNTMFKASSLADQLFSKCDDLYHVMLFVYSAAGKQKLGGGGGGGYRPVL